MLTITVSQLNRYVKSIIEEDSKLADIYIKAEISNLKTHFSSGHIYFMLKDEKSSVKAVMFVGNAKFLKFQPEDGMEVLVKATVGLYEADGSFQVYTTDMQPFGVGTSEIAMRALREKLDKKGYFSIEYKKALPEYPQVIGVITSKTGAAIEDIKKVLSVRYPLVKVKLYGALVQGVNAPQNLVVGIETLDNHCDIIIIGRGGGSKEDLSAFNSEQVAEAVFAASTPIISAVGHESDTTICDLVADQRAATPSVAAELATPSKKELIARIQNISENINSIAKRQTNALESQIELVSNAPILKNPLRFIEIKEKQLNFIHKTMYNLNRAFFNTKETEIAVKAELLHGLSPFKVLSKGYSFVVKNDTPVKSVLELELDDRLSLRLNDGIVGATVNTIEPKGLENEG